MVDFIDALRERTLESFDLLHRDVEEITFLDFPDHTNVGDSAIALGEFAYWRAVSIHVRGVFPGPLTPEKELGSVVPVAFQGGGSLGGLYPPMDKLRLRFIRELNPDTLLIQLPQSVHFTSPELQASYRGAMTSRERIRVAARDISSLRALESIGVEPQLTPDAAHMLGKLTASPATARVVILARTDAEASQSRGGDALEGVEHTDWNPGSIVRRGIHRAKFQFGIPRPARPLFQKSPAEWEQIASNRLSAGLARLSVGETIVTDRLHAMILGLQLGRRVIAVDSSTRKLSAYAEAWLSDRSVPLEFAESFGAALALAQGRRAR